MKGAGWREAEERRKEKRKTGTGRHVPNNICEGREEEEREPWMCAGESFPNNICNESNICNGRKGGEVRREEGKISN